MADLNFVEYTYNLDHYGDDFIEDQLQCMGFTRISESKNEYGTRNLWCLNTCILLVSPGDFTGISGVGLSTKEVPENSDFCDITGFRKTTINDRFSVYTFREDEVSDIYVENFHTVSAPANPTSLSYFCGLVVEDDPDIKTAFVELFGFRSVKHAYSYEMLASPNNRFNLVLDRDPIPNRRTLVGDVNSVNVVTSFLFVNNLNQTYDDFSGHNRDAANNISEDINLSSVKGYNILVNGKGRRYTMDAYFTEVLPGVNLFASERHGYNSVNEDSLKAFHDLERAGL